MPASGRRSLAGERDELAYPARFTLRSRSLRRVRIDMSRSEANLEAVEIAYRSGVADSGENLTLPIIDMRNYLDDLANIHTRIRTFAKLDRLQRTNGTTANEVNWLTANVGIVPNLARMALLTHNQWLENILAGTLDAPYAVKVIRNRPASLKDTCWDSAGVAHEDSTDPAYATCCSQSIQPTDPSWRPDRR